MELSRMLKFPSAFTFPNARCRRMVASPGQCLPQMKPSRITFSDRKSGLRPLANGTHLLKAVQIQHQRQVQHEAAEPVIAKKNDVLWRFLRPFALYTASTQFFCVLARRLVENPHTLQSLNWSMCIKILAALTSLVCTYFFTSGVNQISDIETDKINKPDLPLSSGELSVESAWAIVMGFVAVSLIAARTLYSKSFLVSIFCLLLVGGAYSIPPFRTKASTMGAPITIALMKGFVDFFAIFAGAGAVLGLPFQMSLPMVYMSIFTTLFGLGNGILKDISDMDGDRKNNIPTLATIIGAKKTLIIGTGIHILNHFGCALAAIIRPEAIKCSIVVPVHILSAFYLISQAWKMHRLNYESAQSRKLYTSLWFVYVVQYVLLPFI
uniref:8-prenyl-1,3,6,7-tetrahydroxyxanthone 8-prenyltransferase n=1 Tax=Hypericum sampsonii TaxID=282553 RepID=A0A451ENJ9_9ROSI|nr:8-prenyl-1,3,6,7-tetrahydroxyxanthone 8-prenyltransferase [Hypericum sampsonii]